jgi:hypothetical protein
MKRSTLFLAATLAAGTALMPAVPASAVPLTPSAFAAAAGDLSPLVPVSRSGRRLTAGIIGGLLLGGVIASQYPYRYGYYPYYGYAPYYPAYPVYRPYPLDPAIAYCIRRFKSYDVHSRTYLGYDGRRHRCP